MANSSIHIPKTHLIMALCLPLAVLLGYFLAEPMDTGSMAVVILVLAVLAVPVFMKWYHPLLIVTWNMVLMPYFLPGQPAIWMVVAPLSILFALLNRSVQPERQFLLERSITTPLLALVAVIVITAAATGGVGFKVFGAGTYGGRHYFELASATLGFFGLVSMRIQPEKANLYVGLFFLSAITGFIPNLAYAAGPASYFLFLLFPADLAREQIMDDYTLGHSIVRITGLTMACPAVCCWLLARYGLRGTFDVRKPWRAGLLVLTVVGCLAGGFRSVLIIMVLTVGAMFVYEGLLRTKALFGVIAGILLAGVMALFFAERLPLPMQRTISFLPVKVDPFVKQDAQTSSDWRVEMWKLVLPEIPKYLIKGKGYAIDPDAIELPDKNDIYSTFIAAGEYHNGPLSVIMPFGIFGSAAFIWFLVASFRLLYRNHKSGDPRLQTVNTLLLSTFTARTISFFTIVGSFHGDLWFFVGIMGLSISLNGITKYEEEPVVADEAALELAT